MMVPASLLTVRGSRRVRDDTRVHHNTRVNSFSSNFLGRKRLLLQPFVPWRGKEKYDGVLSHSVPDRKDRRSELDFSFAQRFCQQVLVSCC
jgi:hypothetical protein